MNEKKKVDDLPIFFYINPHINSTVATFSLVKVIV